MQKNLHPFFIPLTTGSPVLPSATEPEDCSTIGDHVFVGLLAWPDPSNHKVCN